MPDTIWDNFAADYSRQLHLERRAVETLLVMLDPSPGERFLDIATGPAVVLGRLANRDGRPREAVGIDSSAEMLRRAPELPAGWELQEGDATKLPFAGRSFDVVCASYILHVLGERDRRAVIDEMARVLRPGGRVGTLTVTPAKSPLMRTLTAPLTRRAEASRGKLLGMRPLDPAADLARASLVETQRARSFVGYPSLCLVARPR